MSYLDARQKLIAEDANNAPQYKLINPTAEQIAQYSATLNLRAVEMQGNGKIDVQATWSIIGPSGYPEVPPFRVALYRRGNSVSTSELQGSTGVKSWNAVDKTYTYQIVAQARSGYQSWNVGLSNAYELEPAAVRRQFPADRTRGNYKIDYIAPAVMGPYGKYRHNSPISGPAITGMTNYTPTQDAHVANVQNYVNSTLSNIPYEQTLVVNQPTGAQTLPPPPAHTVSPGSAISPAEQAARPLPTNGQILGGISAGTAIGAAILGYILLRRKR